MIPWYTNRAIIDISKHFLVHLPLTKKHILFLFVWQYQFRFVFNWLPWAHENDWCQVLVVPRRQACWILGNSPLIYSIGHNPKAPVSKLPGYALLARHKIRSSPFDVSPKKIIMNIKIKWRYTFNCFPHIQIHWQIILSIFYYIHSVV